MPRWGVLDLGRDPDQIEHGWLPEPRPTGSVTPAWYTHAMLHELRVENLLLLDRAELRLAPGLNVLTGETGAGKTLLAHALDLLLGGRARSGIVRAGAAEAYVEGTFSLPARDAAPGAAARPTPRRSCSPGGCGPTVAPGPMSAGARRRWPTCASWAAGCSPSTASTSTAG